MFKWVIVQHFNIKTKSYLPFGFQSKYKKPVSHEQTSDSEVPQKSKKRRTQSYNATTSYRSFRRKAKTPLSSAEDNTSTRAADKSDSSSDYDDEDDGFGDPRNLPSTSSAPILDMNIPSTSTGITANGKGFLFRIANAANDSDDDQSIPDTSHPTNDSLRRALRSPHPHNNNNNHHHPHFQSFNGAHDVSGASSQRRLFLNSRNHHEVPPNGHRKHQTQEDDSSFVEDYASTNSNSLMSSTEDSNDSYPDYYAKKRKFNDEDSNNADENGNGSSNNNSSSFNNNNSFNTVNNNYANGAGSSNGFFGTPMNRLKLTPDSGVSSLPTPSPSSSRGNACNDNQKDVMMKVDAIKRNFRKNIQTSDDDSD